MSGVVLVVVQTRRGEILDGSLAAIGAGGELARAYGARLVLGVSDPDPSAIISQLEYDDIDEIVYSTIDSTGFDSETQEAAVLQFGEYAGALAILFGHTVDAMAIAPSLAARYELGLATDIVGVGVEDGDVVAVRAAYGGQLREEMTFPHPCVVLTVRAGAFEPPRRVAGKSIETTEIDGPSVSVPRTEHRGWTDPAPGGVDITKAEFLLSVGRAIGSPENVARADRLATALGGVMSASRPVIDSGWAEPARQVGQTGKTVKPKVYLALGISGAVQHLAGMSNSETIIAINTDPTAPMFALADYKSELDIMELIEALEASVSQPS